MNGRRGRRAAHPRPHEILRHRRGVDGISNALSALLARTITGTGLASGGGDLTASRVITVPKASGGEVTAGADDTKAITPLASATAMGARSMGVPGYVTHSAS